ncbi:MAG: hypothetical protein V3S69_05280 [Dehalococcoidales bacterium]
MALQFIDGFSHYSEIMEKWDSNNGDGITIATAVGRFSTGSMSIASAVLGRWVQKNLPTAVSTLVSGFAYRPTGAVRTEVGFINNAGSEHVTFELDQTDGSIKVYRGSTFGTLLASSSAGVLSADVWQHIEIKSFIDNVGGFVEAKVDGVSVCSATAVDTQTDVSPLILTFRVDAASANSGKSADLTDLYILDDTGAAPYNTYLGDVKVSVLRPNADGGINNFTPLSGGDSYLEVDDALLDGDATRVSSGTISARDEYALESFADIGATVTTIYGVQVCNGCKKTDAGTIGYKDNLTVGGTVYQGDEVFAPAGSYKVTTTLHQVNPDTSTAWTESTAEAALPGFTLTNKVI